jgi:type I restriction enzyme R subunit
MQEPVRSGSKDKKEFLIFDHWSNFWFFDEEYKEKEPSRRSSLLQQLFEARVALAEAALEQDGRAAFSGDGCSADPQDIKAVMDTRAIDVRDRYRELELATGDRIAQFSVATKADLLSIAAP